MTLKLYGGAASRASLIKWYLEELQVPYEFVILDMGNGEQLQPEFLAINPFGKVPGIVDGEFCLWESGAILMYLADQYAPFADGQQRAIANQWVYFANATLAVGLFLEDRREKEMPRLLTPLNEILTHQEFILESGFSVADVAIASYLYLLQMMARLDYSHYPQVVAYLQRLAQRPAFQTAMAKR